MATVELRFSALPEHVRTARLVAAAVARRAGVDEAVLDEVRLAVGEACTRAVGLHRSNGVTAPVRVVLVEDEKKFSIEVGDEVPSALGVPGGQPGLAGQAGTVPGARAGATGPFEAGVGVGAGVGGAGSAGSGENGDNVDNGDDGDEMGLAVISGLVDDVEVTSGESGGVIRMSWPTTPAPVLP